jgi:Methyltransferase domain
MMKRAAVAAGGIAVVAGGLAARRSCERLGGRLTDSLARRPAGLIGRVFYRDAKPHQMSFRETLDVLALSPEDHLLEIGCGARAIDHSAEMLALARERNATAIADGRLALHEAEAECLPFVDNEFTAVAMTNVFFPSTGQTPCWRRSIEHSRRAGGSRSIPTPPASWHHRVSGLPDFGLGLDPAGHDLPVGPGLLEVSTRYILGIREVHRRTSAVASHSLRVTMTSP